MYTFESTVMAFGLCNYRALKELVGSSYKSLIANMFPNSTILCDKFEILNLSKEAMFETSSF